MAGEKGVDLLMKFERRKDGPIPGEATSKMDLKDDDMLKGFKEGFFFEIDSFTFGTEIKDKDDESEGGGAKKPKQRGKLDFATYSEEIAKGRSVKEAMAAAKAAAGRDEDDQPRDFRAWREGKMKKPYPPELQDITIQRKIDRASYYLMDYCRRSMPFESATLVKRRATGDKVSGLVYLRFDFLQVMITEVKWSDDDQVKETTKFICRGVTMNYKPMLPSGRLGRPKHAHWARLGGPSEFIL